MEKISRINVCKLRILNIGCGSDTYGTDFCDICPQRAEVKKYNADKDILPYGNDLFDEVYSGNMFEHLRNPAHFLEECKRVLKPRGKLIIITDNASFLLFVLNHHYYEPQTEDNLHYMLFTDYHLYNWMRKFGFRDAKVTYERAPLDMNWKALGWIIRLIRGSLMLLLPKELSAGHLRVEAHKPND